jgi:hypothetical protein
MSGGAKTGIAGEGSANTEYQARCAVPAGREMTTIMKLSFAGWRERGGYMRRMGEKV